MKNCEQSKGQSVLEHGISVKNRFFDLVNHLELGTPLEYNWILPDWVYDNSDLIIRSLPNKKDLKYYLTLHDCGKPYCREIDSDGKVHFPNHSMHSYQIFKDLFPDKVVASDLILHDMDIHLLKSVGVDSFCNNPHAVTLLLAGLAEIHSNGEMFGGFESTSFKIKFKNIDRRGKQIFNKIKQLK